MRVIGTPAGSVRPAVQGLPQGGAQETEAESCMEARLRDREGQRTPEKEVAAYWVTPGCP